MTSGNGCSKACTDRRARWLRVPRCGGQGTRGAVRARAQGPFLGLCLGMQVLCIDWRGMCSTRTIRTRPSSTCLRATRSSTCCPSSATSRTRARRCGSGCTRASCSLARSPARPTTSRSCSSGIGIGMSSTTRSASAGDAGLVFSGTSPDGRLVEIAELRDHPFMLGSQFHPELKSRPNRPHPLFRDFVAAAAALAGEQLPLTTTR